MKKSHKNEVWQPKVDSLKNLQSAISFAKLIVSNNLATERHIKKFLDLVVWLVTEKDGKYNQRFISIGVKNKISVEKPILEHVNTRKSVIKMMIEKPNNIDSILKNIKSCLVTKEEHYILNNIDESVKGWDRYKRAGIKVYDKLEEKFLF